MKNLKYYLVFFLVHQSCFLLVAQIQPGTPWMNQLNQGTTLEGNGQEFIRQAEMQFAAGFSHHGPAEAVNPRFGGEMLDFADEIGGVDVC